MKQYRLINEDRGAEIISDMEDYLDSKLTDTIKIPAEAENMGYTNADELEQQLTDEFERNSKNLSNCNTCTNKQLNEWLNCYDYLTPEEALFCLLGLDINHIPNKFSIEKTRSEIDCQVIDMVADQTIEYKSLRRAIKANEKNKLTLSPNGKIYTDDLTDWAVDKFIEEITDNNRTTKNISTQKIKIPNTKRNYPEGFAKELHKQLTRYELISGDFDGMWTWKLPQNALAAFADMLSLSFKKECPHSRKELNILAYIANPGKTTLRKVAPTETTASLSKLKLVISAIKENYI